MSVLNRGAFTFVFKCSIRIDRSPLALAATGSLFLSYVPTATAASRDPPDLFFHFNPIAKYVQSALELSVDK